MIFVAFMDGLSKIAKTVGDQAAIASKKANDALEIAKVNSSIRSEEEKIQTIQTGIGNIVFEKFKGGETIYPEFIESCNNIVEIREGIEALKQKIVLIKNVKVCSSCKAETALNAPFCHKCGSKQEIKVVEETKVSEKKLTCPGCGAEITAETEFCSSCGVKI
jgi:ribosomal protein L40E